MNTLHCLSALFSKESKYSYTGQRDEQQPEEEMAKIKKKTKK